MSAYRRWLILGFEFVLGFTYVLAFGVFVSQSRDFLVGRENDRARSMAMTTTQTEPRTFSFRPGSADTALLGIGWWLNPLVPGRREPLSEDGEWSRSRAYAYLPVPAGDSGLTLTVDGEAFVAPGHDVAIALTVDGVEVASWLARNGEPQLPLVVPIPASATQDGVLELRWDVNKPGVPEQYGFVDRGQAVGFLLRSVTLEAN